MAGLNIGVGNTPIVLNAGSVAALGNSQSTSALLIHAVNSVTAASVDGTKGVRLPVAAAGRFVAVYNEHATNGLPIYPGASGTINGGTANAAITIEGKSGVLFLNTNGTNWCALDYTANT